MAAGGQHFALEGPDRGESCSRGLLDHDRVRLAPYRDGPIHVFDLPAVAVIPVSHGAVARKLSDWVKFSVTTNGGVAARRFGR
jgi:hypothetical protein